MMRMRLTLDRFGIVEKSRPVLRWNSGFLLLCMALADGALFGLNSEADFWEMKIPEGDNEMSLRCNDDFRDTPICRKVVHGVVSCLAMPQSAFRSILANAFITMEYVDVLVSINQIRRQLGKLLDG